MAMKKGTKTKQTICNDDHQDAAHTYLTPHDIMQLCAFWSSLDADFGEIVKADDLKRDVKIVKKSEKAILEITFFNQNQEEKTIQIEIKIYE